MDQPRLLDRVRGAIRARHYSRRTEEAYVGWIKRFIFFHNKRHPAAMGADEVNAFLTSLAVESHVSAATQNQALSAILFLYRVVLEDPLPWLGDIIRAKRTERLPVVLTPSEVRVVIDEVQGVSRLVVQLLYGSGLRLLECLRLRVKDIDFARHEIFVRDPKGGRDRVTTLPRMVEMELRAHLEAVRRTHDADLVWDSARWCCRRRSIASFRMRPAIGSGNGYSRRRAGTSTLQQERNDATIFTNRRCSGRCTQRRRGPVFRSA
jgi:integrase